METATFQILAGTELSEKLFLQIKVESVQLIASGFPHTGRMFSGSW